MLRTIRHNPCLMSPISVLMLLIFVFFSTVTMVLQFPGVVLGFFLNPLLSRSHWAIEFLYPWGIGRWGHFFIMRLIERGRNARPTDKNHGYHSRAVESRLEVVKGRVFIHPLPQFLDNLGYMIVCAPPPGIVHGTEDTPLGRVQVSEDREHRLLALVVDCGARSLQ